MKGFRVCIKKPLYMYVQLICPTLIYPHTTLFWICINAISKYIIFCNVVDVQMNKERYNFFNLNLTQAKLHGLRVNVFAKAT